MKKSIRLNENELIKLVKKILNEQDKNHPINNPLWQQMLSHVEGDGVETIKYIPGKMLVIDAFGNKYTITKG